MAREERITIRLQASGKRAIEKRATEWRTNSNEAARLMLEYAEANMGRGTDAGPRSD